MFPSLLRLSQDINVQESTARCDSDNKGLLRMVNLHLEFCDGKSWVRLSDEMVAQNSREKAGLLLLKYFRVNSRVQITREKLSY